MKISDILVEKTPHLSFEVFPPKTDAAYEGVLKATEAIAELKPSYMSVTYGAGGGTSKNTVKIASHIKDKYNVPSLAHLTCVSSTKEEVHQVIDQLKAAELRISLLSEEIFHKRVNSHFRIIISMHMS